MNNSPLGPSLSATLATNNFDQCVSAWCDFLQQRIYSEGSVSAQQANNWRRPQLAGARETWLENQISEPWLRIIEVPGESVDPFSYSGWFSLEICVENVDQLWPQLEGSVFKIIGEPADLDVSPDIRAMQVIGLAGEVLYLTEIKAEVPGFELPTARCPVDKLFIPVLLTDNRDATLATFEQFPDTQGLKFDTKITVLNNAKNLPLEQRHPVAAVQLSGNSLIEIDQLEGLQPKHKNADSLTPGIALVSFALSSFDHLHVNSPVYEINAGPYQGSRGCMMEGRNGELIELIELPNLTT